MDYYNLGGFYTQYTNEIQSDCTSFVCEDKDVEHHLIHSLSCPKRYEQHLLAHVYSPGSTDECPGCNGRAYVCLMPETEIDDKENDDILGAQHP